MCPTHNNQNGLGDPKKGGQLKSHLSPTQSTVTSLTKCSQGNSSDDTAPPSKWRPPNKTTLIRCGAKKKHRQRSVGLIIH